MENGYVILAIKVVEKAYRDLVHAYKMHKDHDIFEIERFFRNSPFMAVFNIDPEYMIRKAREESRGRRIRL